MTRPHGSSLHTHLPLSTSPPKGARREEGRIINHLSYFYLEQMQERKQAKIDVLHKHPHRQSLALKALEREPVCSMSD